jgi:hypothetical protein
MHPFRRGRHLGDAALAEIWTATAAGEQALDEHLDACAACRARYAALASWLEGVRDEAIAEADQAFPADKLALQQAHILRRLEAMERPARVIAFPRIARPIGAQHSSARRWIAAAAVAGLVIGLAGGQMIDLRRRTGGAIDSFTATSSMARVTTSGHGTEASYRPVSLTSDEAMLMEIGTDPSPYGQMPEPLRALDGLTPRARDYVNTR